MTIRLRDARVAAAARHADPARAVQRRSSSARVHDRRRARRPRRRAARTFRRDDVTPRGRRDRGGRAARRARKAPVDAPEPPRRLRPAHPAPAPAAAGRGRARRAGPVRDRRLELHRPRAAQPAASAAATPPAVELENPMSAEQSMLRMTLLGSLLDVAAAKPRPRRRRRSGCSRPAPSFLPEAGQQLPREPYHVAAILIGAVRPRELARPAPAARPTSSPSRACSRACSTRSASTVSSSVARRAVPASRARRPRSWIGGEPAGWVGEVHPLVAAEWDIERDGRGVRARPRRGAPSRRRPRTSDVDELPRGPRGPGGRRPRAGHRRAR